MPPPSVCRLCANKCLNFKKLYNENGHCTYENDLTQKYLDSTILNMEMAKHLTVICSQCWHHVLDYHNFRQCVILAQTKLVSSDIPKANPSTELVAKQEVALQVDDNIPITIEDEPIQMLVLEEDHVEPIECENKPIDDPLFSEDNATNDNNVNNTFAEDSDDSLTDFLGFDVKIENDLELIDDVHSSNSSHSSDIEMVMTPKTETPLTVENDQPIKNVVRNTQIHSGAGTSNSNITDRTYFRPYQRRTSNKELDAVVYEVMPNIHCVECHEAFSSFSSMRSHFRKKHPKLEFYMKCCNAILKTRGCVEGHFRNHKSPRYFKCDFCDKSYSLKKYLNVHMMQCHPDIRHSRTHKCPKCQQAFALQYFLKQHLKNCNGLEASNSTDQLPNPTPGTSSQFFQGEVGDYVCIICEKVCTNIVALRKHTWYHHRAERKHKCSFCEKSFPQRVEWREHMAIQHTGEHLYACPNCPNTFLRRSLLLVHQRELHGIKSARSCCTPPRRCPMHSQAEANVNTNSD